VTRLCVYCGSQRGARPAYAALAAELGRALAARGIGMVYGGSNVGTMGVLADAVLAAGGEAIGVIPGSMVDREIAHSGLTKLHVVRTMHERKQLMAELSDAFLALPGGLGTLDELFEALTWAYLGLHAKPIALLDHDDYWRGLLAFLDHAMQEGFVRAPARSLVRVARTIDDVFPILGLV
jgi:hypothetical protein